MLFLLIPIFLFALAVSLAVWRIKRSKTAATVVFLVLFLLPSWDEIFGNIYFNYLCHARGGQRIYKTVKGVDGYYRADEAVGCNDDCMEELLKNRAYQFIEVNVPKPDPRFLTKEAGLYRFHAARKGSPLCRNYFEMMSLYPSANKKEHLEKLPDDVCVAAERIETLKSQYAYDRYKLENVLIEPLRIIKAETTIRSISTGETLGEAVTFLYYGPWWLEMIQEYVKPVKCPGEVIDGNKTGIHTSILKEVLVPERDG